MCIGNGRLEGGLHTPEQNETKVAQQSINNAADGGKELTGERSIGFMMKCRKLHEN